MSNQINSLLKGDVVSLAITFIASFLIWFMFIGLFILWRVHGRINRRHIMEALLASFAAWFLTEIVKSLYPSARPFMMNGEVPLTLTIPSDPSFPSGHTSAAFAMAASIQKYSKKAGLFFLIGAILVGIGRVLSNVHFMLDIFAGAFLGIFCVYVLRELKVVKI